MLPNWVTLEEWGWALVYKRNIITTVSERGERLKYVLNQAKEF